jgi:predicted DNA-binding protein
MARSATSSYRLDAQTMAELTETARRLGKGKNTLIAEAIREYLHKLRSTWVADEARRQSLNASESSDADGAFWEQQFDERRWK